MKLSKEKELEIVNLYKSGKKIRPIARETGLDRRTIQHALLRAGVEIEGSKLLNNVPEDIQLKIRDDLLSLKYHAKEIAIRQNVSTKAVRKIQAVYNIYTFKKLEPTKIHRFNEYETNHILSTYGKTESLLSLSKIHNLSRGTIKKLLVKNGIKILKGKETEELRVVNKKISAVSQDIIKDYKDGMSIPKINKKYKIWVAKIREVLENHDVKLNPRGHYTRKHFTPQEELEIIELHSRGKTDTFIGKKFNISNPTIVRILKRHGINRKCGLPISHAHRSWGVSGYYNGFNFRSMNELSFIINYIEKKKLTAISGERTDGIQYFNSKDNRWRTYYPDFILSNGFVIEIKPKRLWPYSEVVDKKVYAIPFFKKINKEYRLADYPVKLNTIFSKYFSGEIKFSQMGLEKFTRIYKKDISIYLEIFAPTIVVEQIF